MIGLIGTVSLLVPVIITGHWSFLCIILYDHSLIFQLKGLRLVVDPTHARGRTLDLLMTDVPDLVWVAVVALIVNSDHSSL